ncbi:MAG TPA: ATP-dependent DNA helicase RecQ [Thermoanaerobaculia bacterium]|jgi:ATP-dependent DNA helicase RecQ
MSDLRQSLKEKFGFDAFRPGQEEVLGHLMAGRSAAAVFPTGGGKSLCYQLPALELPGLTLVVSPLIALMKDQIDQLRRRGIAAARLDSSLTLDEHREVMGGVRSGALKLLYVAPERFNNERFREAARRLRVSLFAVDEAHCISEWGHNFRPDYLKLAGFARDFGAERVLALTATATPQVLDDVCRGFDIAPACAVRTGFYRPNLTLLATPASAAERDALLLARMKEREPGPTIVYVTLQRTSEEVAGRLAAAGFDARAYHAGMETEDRNRVQEAFLASDRAVVVATIAFGMGIDKPDIRYVYHYNLPKSLENYSQEIGRAGRDRLPSTCEMLVCPDDLNALEGFVYGDTPGPEAVRGFVDDAFVRVDEHGWNLTALSSRNDVRVLVVRTLLTYLELDGYLEAGTPWYSSYRFRPLKTSKEILERFEGERRELLRSLFKRTKKAKIWLDVDLDGASRDLRQPRDRLVRALDYLAEQELIELQAAGVRHPYRCLRRPEDPDALAASLHERTLERERREIARLGQVLELAALDACQVSHLSGHFGEPLEAPCGHCGRCLSGAPLALPPRRVAAIDEKTWNEASALRRAEPEALGEARAFARFLAGVGSPRLSRRRLGKHPLFGRLADVPFAAILEKASAS